MDGNLRVVQSALLHGRTWRYLRYAHAREALSIAQDVESVTVVGAGHGTAEIALALEFTNIRFCLTDWDQASHNSARAQAWVKKWRLPNVRFASLNILDPGDMPRADLVYSVEVLEHIEDDRTAAENMRRLAKKYVFCMVPFAEESLNQREDKRADMLARFGHHVAGYNAERLVSLFPLPVAVRGTYWANAGARFRAKLTELDDATIDVQHDALIEEAHADLIERIPTSHREAAGIWWLARP